MILSLAYEIGLRPKRVAASHGGEYHSPCPSCGGKDRFIIWNATNRYYCRQCEAKGDAIQFCRDFMSMDYRAACNKLGLQEKIPQNNFFIRDDKFSPETALLPSDPWQIHATEFVHASHQNLWNSSEGLSLLHERGFSSHSINCFTLGWNPSIRNASRHVWGLSRVINELGLEKSLWLPSGIVIPTISSGKVTKIKIRRNDWKTTDSLPKYAEISGSMKCPSFFGSPSLPIVLVEAELDALLIQQEAANLCCCIALGGASKKPDLNLHKILQQAPLILFALDFDDAGKKAFHFWNKTYPRLKAWPVPREKSPGDALKAGVDLRKWIADGLTHYHRQPG